MRRRLAVATTLMLTLAACSGRDSQERPGEVPVFDEITEDEVITLLGTEPFWSARIESSQLTYSTPDNFDGEVIEITRFAGNGGLGFSGTLQGAPLQVAVTPGDCSDGMSDRTYPLTATLSVGEANLLGCGYTDRKPFTGEENP